MARNNRSKNNKKQTQEQESVVVEPTTTTESESVNNAITEVGTAENTDIVEEGVTEVEVTEDTDIVEEVDGTPTDEDTNKPEVGDEPSKDEEPVKTDVPTIKTFDDLLAYAKQNITDDTRAIVNMLEHYKTVIDTGDVKDGVKVKYTLFLAIKKLINEPSYNKFVKGFELLNKFFMIDNGRYLGTHNHASNDTHWIFGLDNKIAHTLLIETLNKLSNPSTRHTVVKKMNMEAVLKNLDTNGVRNLSRFYNL